MQKGGTTALTAMLRLHPGVLMSRPKEPHFFDSTRIDWDKPNYKVLHQAFAGRAPEGKICGESTPIYSYWPPAMARVRDYNPQARIILSLRHPSYRAFSQWRMERERGSEALSFAEAIADTGRARGTRRYPGVHRLLSHVDRGFYARQIEAMLVLFPRDQIHWYRSDRMWAEPLPHLQAIERFLGLETFFDAAFCAEHFRAVNARPGSGFPEGTREKLDAIYAEDIARTASLTGLDLNDCCALIMSRRSGPEAAQA